MIQAKLSGHVESKHASQAGFYLGGGGGGGGPVWCGVGVESIDLSECPCEYVLYTISFEGGGGEGTYPGLHSSDKTLTGLWVEMNRGQCVHACPCVACRVTCQHVMCSM